MRVPTPALFASLFFYSTLNILNLIPPIPIFWISSFGQVLIALNLGSRFTRDTFYLLKKIPFPVIIATVLSFSLSILSGYIFIFISHADMVSVMISIAPGGTAEMLALGESMHADTALIAFVQTTRMVAILICTPLLVKLSNKNYHHEPDEFDFTPTNYLPLPKKEIIVLLLLSVLSSAVMLRLNVPAGVIVGTLVASVPYLLLRNKKIDVSRKILYVAHICIGLAAARFITLNTLFRLYEQIIPLTLIIIIIIFGSFFIGNFISYITKWDKVTCQLACSSGGFMQMVITAQEMEANVPVVIFFHLVRLMGLIFLWPILIPILFT